MVSKMKKLLFIYLSIFTVFIVSCGNKVLNPSENVYGITYYDVNNTETAKFNIANLNENNGIDSIASSEFKKIAESSHAIVYIQSGKSFDMNTVKELFTKFEANYDEEVRIYGEPISFPTINNDKLVFLIYNFYPKSEGYFAGFFNPSDFYDDKPDTLNKGKYMYINITTISYTDLIVGTMLHEFQHLINASVNIINGGKAMDLWLNEALSESTSVLFSHFTADDRKKFVSLFHYYSFYSWYIDKIIGYKENSIYFSYSGSSVFMRWILEKGGREAIRDIAHSSPSLDTRTRLVNSVQGLNIGNSVEEIFKSWIKDMYNGKVSDIKFDTMDFMDDRFDRTLMDSSQRLPLAPGGFIIYDANKYNLNNQSIKTEPLDAANNIYLAWNGNFDSVDVEGKINANDVIWIAPIKISTTPSTSKSEMLNFDYSKFSRMPIDKVLTPEEVIRAKSRK